LRNNRRRPAPVKTSIRLAGSGTGIDTVSDMAPAPRNSSKLDGASQPLRGADSWQPSWGGSPGREPRNPARHVGAIGFILASEAFAERRLLIGKYKNVESDKNQRSVKEQAPIAEQDRLAQNDVDKGNVNGIAHMAIEPRHHEVLRRCDRC